MAKKRTNPEARARQFKYGNQAKPAPAAVASQEKGATTTVVETTSDGRNFGYVARDLRMIILIGGALLIAELILSYLFDHTGLGAAVYSIVNV